MTLPPNTPIPSIDQRAINQLEAILKKRDAEPTILTLDEFRRYAPLYQTANRTNDALDTDPKLAELANEFQSRISLYKPIHVVRSRLDPTVVLRLPQILVPLRSLSHSQENEKAVAANYNYRRSDLPKIWSRAQNLMTSALLQEQTAPEQISMIAAVRAKTQEIMNEINQVYGRPVIPTPASEAPAETENLIKFNDDAFEDL